MSLDRWLVTSMPSEGRRWPYALPRVAMALLLGYVISTPLVLYIFHSEIDAQIAEIKQRESSQFLVEQKKSAVGAEVDSWTKSVSALQRVVASGGDVALDPNADPRIKAFTKDREAAQALADKTYTEWQCQLYGGRGCTVAKVGAGPLAQASGTAYEKAKSRVNYLNGQIEDRKGQLTATDDNAKQARLDQAEQDLPKAQEQLGSATRRQNDLRAKFDADNRAANGLLIRIKALSEVSGKDFSLNAARILLFLLFLMIECLPVVFKLMQRHGNYERILADAQRREYRESRHNFSPGPGRDRTPSSGGGGDRSRTVRQMWEEQEHDAAGEEERPATRTRTKSRNRESDPFSADSYTEDSRAGDGYTGESAKPISEPTESPDRDHTSAAHHALQQVEDTRTRQPADGSADRTQARKLFTDDD